MEESYTTNYSQSTPPAPKKESALSEIVRFSIIALLIVIPIRFFIAQPFIVSGASMDPTFENGQYLIIDQLSYRLEKPQRGEVIVFRFPKVPSKYFIKRIIGLPGDTLSISGKTITVTNDAHPQGFVLDESYVAKMDTPTTLTETLGDDEYFVMGDNRDQSSDSRMWGVLPEKLIVGRTFLRLLPLTQAGIFPGYVDTSTE